jgi:hypothetical protein
LEVERVELERILDLLYQAVLQGDEDNADEASRCARVMVEAINERVANVLEMSITQPMPIRHDLEENCGKMESMMRKIVKATIDTLRNGREEVNVFRQLLNDTKEVNAKLMPVKINIDVKDLSVKGAVLDPDDIIKNTLTVDDLIVARVKPETDGKKKKKKLEENPLK